jgi:hypothetical protein
LQDAKVFGQPTSQAQADVTFENLRDQATPSPRSPKSVPGGTPLNGYYLLWSACDEIKKTETDGMRLMEVEKCQQFAEKIIDEEIGEAPSEVGAPGPPQPPANLLQGGFPSAVPPQSATPPQGVGPQPPAPGGGLELGGS